MAKEVVVTHEGYKKLEEELDTLKTVKRSEIAEKIKAKDHCLSRHLSILVFLWNVLVDS